MTLEVALELLIGISDRKVNSTAGRSTGLSSLLMASGQRWSRWTVHALLVRIDNRAGEEAQTRDNYLKSSDSKRLETGRGIPTVHPSSFFPTALPSLNDPCLYNKFHKRDSKRGHNFPSH